MMSKGRQNRCTWNERDRKREREKKHTKKKTDTWNTNLFIKRDAKKINQSGTS